MGIYLPNMEMPTKQTTLVIFPNGYVAVFDVTDSFIGESRCVPVPPHGDLIDIDETLKHLPESYGKEDLENVIATAPTIIPASGGKEDE